jgi:hypothetical protein
MHLGVDTLSFCVYNYEAKMTCYFFIFNLGIIRESIKVKPVILGSNVLTLFKHRIVPYIMRIANEDFSSVLPPSSLYIVHIPILS